MSIDAVLVRFATAGVPEVSAAFEQVASRARKFEDAVTGASEKAGRARVSLADREAREKIKADAKVAKEAEKAQKQQTTAQEKEAKRRSDIIRRSSEMAGRDAVKAAREEAREIERIEEQKSRARLRATETASRAAARQAAEELKGRERVASAGSKYASTWGSRIGSAATMLGATAGIGGAFAVADAVKREMSDERNAAQLVNLVTSGTKAPEGANVKNILAQAGAVSRDTGMDRSEIVEASKAYAKNAQHGDFAGVMGNMGLFAKLAKVTGSDMGTIAEAAGTLQSQNPDLDPAAMKQMLLDANEMSKQGKMSFSESLAQMGKVGSTRSSYAGNVANNQRTLIGYAQLAKSGGTADEVGTFVSALAAESTEANKKFRKEKGRDLFKTDQFGRIASPDTFVEDVLRNTGGNIQEINKLMGRRGGALFREVEQSYIQGAGSKNNVEAGIKSVKAYMGEVTGARGSEEGLDAQFQQTMNVPAEKFGTAINKIEESLREQLAPALESFANKLSDPRVEQTIDTVISAVGKLADYFVSNPLAGLGQIVAAVVTKDILSAAIGSSIKTVLLSILNGSGVPGLGEGAGGVGGALGKVGAAVGIVAGATAITMAGMSGIDAYFSTKRDVATRDVLAGVAGDTDAFALRRKAREGKVTAGDIAKMTERKKAQEQIVADKQAAMQAGPGVVAKLTGMSAEVSADQKAQYDLQKQALDDMVKSLKEATRALSNMKNTVPPAVPPVTTNTPPHPVGNVARG